MCHHIPSIQRIFTSLQNRACPVPHIQVSCIKQNSRKPRKIANFNGAAETEEETGKDPNGDKANSGPGAIITSGFGGLGLEGIVGRDDSVGEGAIPLGVGNKGVMSGDKVGVEAMGIGALGKNAGAADIVETCACI
ncbi:hypothetical protein Pint_01064 [Pistacia integerrima]|uniref:Uncharacterized protein n=1 Tax=Pistacia integerrima TaxID=434235 RepID=A0ACC0ZL78_9ROSI|nr:hypothetical protein Pint_01064 [Pistacia integerrima]